MVTKSVTDTQLKNNENHWLALMIGNSRLHWGLFAGQNLLLTTDTEHLPESTVQQLAQCQTLNKLLQQIFPNIGNLPPKSTQNSTIILASVVPSQTALWQKHFQLKLITLDQIPLKGIYPTLGSDRALALWGAGKTWGFPILVIDAGTALTFTGADVNQTLIGGAILPGFNLQLSSLGQKTGQLPLLETSQIIDLPPRFALNTQAAIYSGVIYILLSGIKDFIENWLNFHPESKIVLTGGDRTLLTNLMPIQFPEIAAKLIVEKNLIFWGMSQIVKSAE
ncbi:MAG TPA: pantothenate kinase [Nostocaceae cyanobacterium]|nr:pantothenate kinase [Nostocaceae cyanobacterium]